MSYAIEGSMKESKHDKLIGSLTKYSLPPCNVWASNPTILFKDAVMPNEIRTGRFKDAFRRPLSLNIGNRKKDHSEETYSFVMRGYPVCAVAKIFPLPTYCLSTDHTKFDSRKRTKKNPSAILVCENYLFPPNYTKSPSSLFLPNFRYHPYHQR